MCLSCHFCVTTFFWIWLGIFLFVTKQAAGDIAIVNVSYVRDREGENSQKRSYISFCAAYNAELSNLPTIEEHPKWVSFKYGGDEMNLCEDPYQSEDLAGKMLAAPRRNCSAYEQVVTAMRQKASGLIIVTKKMFHPGQPNTTSGAALKFPILVLHERFMAEILELPFAESWEVTVYGLPEVNTIEWSGICLIIIAVFVITVGSFRSGRHRFIYIEDMYERVKNAMEPHEVSERERTGINFGSVAVVVFAVFMTGLLLLMYYFYDYLVYLFIGLFVIGATSGMFECFKPLLTWSNFASWRIPTGKIFGVDLDIRVVVLFLISLALSSTWVVIRNESYGWLFLDVLGSFLLVSVIVGIQLPSLKACTIFLCLLFVYDIFFVFITPFFTKDGQSVMIQVATGGYDPTKDSGSGHRETIPAAFKIPHIPMGKRCEDVFEDSSYSLLGFGDVMVPGFLISFLRSFELVTRIRPVYSIPACIGYAVSLVLTTVALVLMRTGQPALLYIVPILLTTVFFVAWRRRETSTLWAGNLGHLYETYLPIHMKNDIEKNVLDSKKIQA